MISKAYFLLQVAHATIIAVCHHAALVNSLTRISRSQRHACSLTAAGRQKAMLPVDV
jgi:hypothetical protein